MHRFNRISAAVIATATLASSGAAVAAPLTLPVGPASVNPLISVMKELRRGHHIALTPQERGPVAPPSGVPAAPSLPAPPQAASPTPPAAPAVQPPAATTHGENSPASSQEAAAPASAATAAQPVDIPSGVVTIHSVQDVKKLGEELKRATEQMNRSEGD